MRGLPGLVAAIVALSGSLALAGSSTGAARADTQPPYYFNKGAGFEIYSNRAWHGVAGTAGVREGGVYTNHTPRDPDRSYRIWTPSCKPGQKFSVSRSVDLLGPPTQVDFSFAATMYVASNVVLVNGHPAAKSVGNNSPNDLQPAQLKLFHPGMNELTVVVTLPSTPTVCTSSGTPPSVWFEIAGYFGADLSVGTPKAGETVTYFKADSGRTVTTHIHVTNDGPDVIPDATVTVMLGGRGFCTDENPDHTCKSDADYQFTMVATEILGGMKCTTTKFTTVACVVTSMKPGETRFVTVILRYRPDPADPSWAQEEAPLTWQAQIDQSGPADTNSGNNQGQVGYVFCSTRSTAPGCKTAQ